jgi:hypothetical protein
MGPQDILDEVTAYNKQQREARQDFESRRDIINRLIVADPEYYKSSGFLEDVIRIGPQIVAQIGIGVASGGTASGAFMGVQILGSTYDRARSKGASHERALGAGMANAIMQAPLEALGLTKLSKFWKTRSLGVNKLKELGTLFGQEWMTEMLQAYPEEITNLFAENPDKDMLDATVKVLSDKKWETFKQGAKEGLVVLPWTLLGASPKIARRSDWVNTKQEDDVQNTGPAGLLPAPVDKGAQEIDETTPPPKVPKPEGKGIEEEEKQEEPTVAEIIDVPETTEDVDKGDLETPTAVPSPESFDLTGEEAADILKDEGIRFDAEMQEGDLGFIPGESEVQATIIDEDSPANKTTISLPREATKEQIRDKKEEKEAQFAPAKELPPVPKPETFKLKRPDLPSYIGDNVHIPDTQLRRPSIAYYREDGTLVEEVLREVPRWDYAHTEAAKKVKAEWARGKELIRKSGVKADLIEGFHTEKVGFVDKRAKIKKSGQDFINLRQHFADQEAAADAAKTRERYARIANNPGFNLDLSRGFDDLGRAIVAGYQKVEESNKALAENQTKAHVDEVIDLITEKKVTRNAVKGSTFANFLNESDKIEAQVAAAEAIWKWRLNPKNKGNKLNPGLAVTIGKQAISNFVRENDIVGGRRQFAEGKRVPVLTGEDIDALHDVDDLTLQIESRSNKLREQIQAYIAKVKDPALKKKANDLLLKEVGVSKEDVKAVNKAVSKKQRVPDESASIFNQIAALQAIQKEGTVVEAIVAQTQETGEPVRAKVTITSGRVGEGVKGRPNVVMQQIERHGPYPRRITAEINAEDMQDERPNNQFIVERGPDGRDFVVIESAPVLSGVARGDIVKEQEKSKLEKFKEAVEKRRKAGKKQIKGKRAAPTKRPKRVKEESKKTRLVSVDKAAASIQREFREQAPIDSIEGMERELEKKRQSNIDQYGTPLERAKKGKTLTKQEAKKRQAKKPKKKGFDFTSESGKTLLLGDAARGIIKTGKATKDMVAGLKDGTIDIINRRVFDWLDIQAPWTRRGAIATGRALKNIFSIRARHQIETKNDTVEILQAMKKDLGTDKVSDQTWFDIMLTAEDTQYLNSKHSLHLSNDEKKQIFRLSKAINAYFKKKEQLIKKFRPDAKLNFQARMIAELEQKKVDKELTPDEVNKIDQRIDRLKRLKFVHIPVAVIYTNTLKQLSNKKISPKKKKDLKGLLDLMTQKKRTVVGLQEIYDRASEGQKKDLMKLINPATILMNYGHRFAKDMALINLAEALEEDGLMKPIKGNKKPKGWVETSSFQWGILGGNYIDPQALESLTNMLTVDQETNRFWRAMGYMKMGAFFNPVFLPLYDVYQSVAMAGSLFRRMPHTTAKHMKRAVEAVLTQNDTYKEAMNTGLFSKPFDFPQHEWIKEMKVLLKGTKRQGGLNQMASMGLRYFILNSKHPLGPLNAAYRTSWALAWKMDEMVRVFTYLQLADKSKVGKGGDIEAGQLAARFHGDYAKVPAKTRRKLNRLFFTPTFKIAMFGLYKDMAKGLVKSAYNVAKGDVNFKDPQAVFGTGLLSLAVFTMAFDQVMRAYGFEPEDDKWYNFGRRYVRTIDTDYGPKQEIWTWSNPGNITQRYLQRAMNQKWRKNPWKGAYNVLKWDLHPMWAFTSNLMMTGMLPDGTQVMSQFDDDHVIAYKTALASFSHIIKIGEEGRKMFGHMDRLEGMNKQLTDDHVRRNYKQWKTFINGALSIMSVHLRDMKEVELSREIDGIMRDLDRDQEKYFMKHEELNEVWLRNAYDRIEKVMEKF